MTVFDRIAAIGVVPVVAIDNADHAVDLADALAEGGLPIAEITFRTDAARDAITSIAKARPDFFVGAGTVVTTQQVVQTKAAGAQFALAPGTDPLMIEAAQAAGLPYAPGIMTPSDLQIATRLECRFLKFFPAGLAGGPKMLAIIAAPFAHLALSFNPTGGINPSNMGDWLVEPNVRAVGGTWIATRQDIADGNWAVITQNARDAVARVKATREVQDV
jgi:2-dehydro-3-deoxyphosphogluconate aldolase / (4S)-4-hydroxy-2-oxoglutarate aldolase